MSRATVCSSAYYRKGGSCPPHAASEAAGEELFLSYGAGFWTFQRDSFRAIKREKQREWQLEQVSGHVALPYKATVTGQTGVPA